MSPRRFTEHEVTATLPNIYGFEPRLIEEARDRLFPGHWTYGEALRTLPSHLQPAFIIRPRDWVEQALAQVAKPDNVRLFILHETH